MFGQKKSLWDASLWEQLELLLIDKKGKILKIWTNVKVKDHAKEVLETLENIVKK